jgi:hypothetical protein
MEISPLIKLLFWITLLGLCVYYIFYWFMYEVRERIKISRNGKKAMSTIIDFREDTDADGAKSYFPIHEFTTESGKRMIVESQTGKNTKDDLGKQVMVYYLPDDPYQFFLEKSAPVPTYILPFGLVIMAAIVYAIVKTIQNF